MKTRQQLLLGLSLSAATLSAAMLAAACSRSGSQPPPPAASAAEGGTVATAYSAKNNAANAQRDARAVGAIEANPLREMSLAGYLVDKALKRPPSKPFDYQRVRTYAMRFTGPRVWFLSVSQVAGRADATDLSVFVRDEPTAPWLKALSVGIGRQAIGSVPLAAGAAQPPSTAETRRADAALRGLAAALASGRVPPTLQLGVTGAKAFTTMVAADRKVLKGNASARVSCAPAPASDRFALRTTGGQVVLSSLVCRYRLVARPGRLVTLRSDWRALTPEPEGKDLTVTLDHMVALSVGTAGTTVLGDSWDAVAAATSR